MVPYFHGRVLDIGANRHPLFPHFIHHSTVKVDEPDSFSVFTSNSLDGIFSYGLLNLAEESEVNQFLQQFYRVVKPGGYLVLDLPIEDKNNRWEVTFERALGFMSVLHGWTLVDFQEMDNEEKCLWFAFMLGGKEQITDIKKPEKTCAVTRLGAFGDMIQASSIFPWLKEQGYHVTLYCSDTGYDIVKHDPHVDRFIIQGKDEVPPDVLSEFWDYTKPKYTKWVNLCESVEGTLLPPPGRTNHAWPDSVRAKRMDINYLEFTHELAEVPAPYRPKFYATQEEKDWAKKEKTSRSVLWSLSGSSVHKTWPHVDSIIARIMLQYRDVDVYLVGDELCQILESGWGKEKRVHCQSGKWSIRQSMAFAEVADLIIGTETGLLNAAGSLDVPKIVMLSHSSPEMLTKHWKNAIPLAQKSGCHKHPCRQLHQTWEHCMKHEETGTSVCMNNISPDQVWAEVRKVLG
jgi:ADP-heptose:LPS heptosyltransferase